MFKLMQAKAVEIYLQQQQQQQQASGENPSVSASNGSISAPTETATDSASTPDASDSSTSKKESNTPVQDSIRSKLEKELEPLLMEIIDDSNKHAGHAGHRGSASYSGETHFTVSIVSSKFEGLTSIKRHRFVYQVIDEEMGNPIHALSLVTKTPSEAGMV